MHSVFERARAWRRVSWCWRISTRWSPTNRSFFLNEMDGFAANGGILTLATSNHPERLDPAIVQRPSRFDRTYRFDLPAQRERAAYMRTGTRSTAAGDAPVAADASRASPRAPRLLVRLPEGAVPLGDDALDGGARRPGHGRRPGRAGCRAAPADARRGAREPVAGTRDAAHRSGPDAPEQPRLSRRRVRKSGTGGGLEPA